VKSVRKYNGRSEEDKENRSTADCALRSLVSSAIISQLNQKIAWTWNHKLMTCR
jgi:hypothetical protein